MLNVTSISAFIDEPYKIPNAVNESAGADSNAGLNAIISEAEKGILPELLGQDQYDTLQTELNKLPFNPQSGVNADQVYVDLVNGDGVWQGIRPLLTNFIFCMWLEETEVRLTMVGSGKGKSQGFTVADNSSKYVKRWNTFVSEVEELCEYLDDSGDLELPDEYPTYETQNSLGI